LGEDIIKDQDKKGFEIGPAIELLKSIKVIAGTSAGVKHLYTGRDLA
jgi:hypothetical protein